MPFSLALHTGDLTAETLGLALVDVVKWDELAAVALGAERWVGRLDLGLLLKVPSPGLGGDEFVIIGQDGLATALCWKQVRALGGHVVAVDDAGVAPVVETGTAVHILIAQVIKAGDAGPLIRIIADLDFIEFAVGVLVLLVVVIS